MKNRSIALRVLLAASLGASLALPGCRKYDQDGSLLHLRTPEARLIGTWNSARVQQLGTDADTNITELLSGNNLRLVADFRRDGGVTISKLESDLVYEGSWEFNEDKTILHLDLMYDLLVVMGGVRPNHEPSVGQHRLLRGRTPVFQDHVQVGVLGPNVAAVVV